MPSARALDECLTGLVDGLPVGIVAGLLDSLFQRRVEGVVNLTKAGRS